MAAAAELACALAPLPQPLALRILALLPVDARARCACVSPGWRATVADVSLWLRLDLMAAGGVPQPHLTDALLRGAAARAGGQLQFLAVDAGKSLSWRAVRDVVTANGGSLRELHYRNAPYGSWPGIDQAEALLRAAPALSACHLDVHVDGVADARRVLRCEPPFGLLRLHTIFVGCQDLDEAALRDLAAQVAQYGYLTLAGVHICGADLRAPAAVDAIVDALITRRCSIAGFLGCSLEPAAAPWLVRLLRVGALAELKIDNGYNDTALLDAPAAALLASALRDNTTLRSLELTRIQLWHDPAVAAALMDALVGHRSLRSLTLTGGAIGTDAAAPLGALVSACGSALEALYIINARHVTDATELRPLLEALPSNTRLRELRCKHYEFSTAFARDVLLPAVRANTSLRSLKVTHEGTHESAPFLREAEALVTRRAEAAAA
jgi:hypothetical protein